MYVLWAASNGQSVLRRKPSTGFVEETRCGVLRSDPSSSFVEAYRANAPLCQNGTAFLAVDAHQRRNQLTLTGI